MDRILSAFPDSAELVRYAEYIDTLNECSLDTGDNTLYLLEVLEFTLIRNDGSVCLRDDGSVCMGAEILEDFNFRHMLKLADELPQEGLSVDGDTILKDQLDELCDEDYTGIYDEIIDIWKEARTDREKSLIKKMFETFTGISLKDYLEKCVITIAEEKHNESKVRKSLPAEFSYIIQELLHESSIEPNKHAYINVIISTIITTKRADDFIIAMCNLIQRLTIDSLHIVGDIYDRGPGAHIIMDTLCNYHNFDIQWGNHDILWMGAASGNDSCIANVIRMSMRYGNLGTLEDGYGINLLPLATFAMDTYADDPCTIFMPKMNFADAHYNEKTLRLITQMHKAITIIQFKLEAEIIDRRPEFGMTNRKLLEKIDFERGVFVYEGKEYALRDTNFPTVDPADPYRLTEEERELVEKIHYSFMNSEKLKKHMRCLFTYGGMYLVSNSNLLYHASVPLNEDGSFKHVKIRGKEYWGRKLLDKADQLIRTAYFDEEGEEDKEFAMDYIWYMWCGPEAPLFDKDKMATFERYFVEDKELHKEKKGYYYTLRNREDVCDQILAEFGASGPHSHIINGHVPVKTIQGEQPMKANGKLFVIDGGFSKAYQPETGIAGYTLVYHSHGMQLVQHEPFQSRQKAIEEGLDIKSTNFVLEFNSQRMMVKDTDKGKELVTQIQDLKKLLVAYRTGLIKEKV